MRGTAVLAILTAALACGAPVPPADELGTEPSTGTRADWENWRRERIESLTEPEGWLSLVGLFWLETGENRFGTDPSLELVLPQLPALDSLPPHLGTFVLDAGQVRLEVEPGVDILSAGEPITAASLVDDAEGEPTRLELGSLVLYVIARDGHLGIRVKDRERPARASFPGIETFPWSAGWRLLARLEPYSPPRQLQVPSVLPWDAGQVSSGSLRFTVDGSELAIDAFEASDDRLFLVFGDETNGVETYSGGRYLYTEPPDAENRVVIDFNRAYSPPCLFTPYATCPLPPPQNRLALRIEAGEKSTSFKP